ncbi:putative pseudouridylate synthase [Ixodes scapularis]
MADRRVKPRTIAQVTGIFKDTVQCILIQHLDMHKVSKVPRLLSCDQKLARYTTSRDKLLSSDPTGFRARFVTGQNVTSVAVKDDAVINLQTQNIKRTTRGFNCKNSCDSRTYTYVLPTFAFAPPESPAEESYRITEERIGEVNNVLALYKGCHNYHNFTSGKKSEDPSAMRYIISAECAQPFVQGDQEFVQVQIKGQSFMLHQIRKMVGLVIAIMRGCTKETTIRRAWGPEKLDLPIAPALGLMLEEVHYDRYNKRYGGDGLHEPLTWEEKQDIIQSFKEKHIYPTILETEKNEKSMLTWMENLPLHTYDVREPGPPTSDEAEHCDIAAEQEHVSCNELQGQDCEQETLRHRSNLYSKQGHRRKPI